LDPASLEKKAFGINPTVTDSRTQNAKAIGNGRRRKKKESFVRTSRSVKEEHKKKGRLATALRNGE